MRKGLIWLAIVAVGVISLIVVANNSKNQQASTPAQTFEDATQQAQQQAGSLWQQGAQQVTQTAEQARAAAQQQAELAQQQAEAAKERLQQQAGQDIQQAGSQAQEELSASYSGP